MKLLMNKIHRVLKRKQPEWMKKYIDFNTEKRTNAANSLKKNLIDDQFWLLQINEKITKKNQRQTRKQRKRFFKIHQQTNAHYS